MKALWISLLIPLTAIAAEKLDIKYQYQYLDKVQILEHRDRFRFFECEYVGFVKDFVPGGADSLLYHVEVLCHKGPERYLTLSFYSNELKLIKKGASHD